MRHYLLGFSPLLGLILALNVVACATAPRTAPQGVYTMETALIGAEQLATIYAELPTCTPGVIAGCSDPATTARMVAAGKVANAAVLTAQAIVTDPATSAAARAQAMSDAQAAVDALTTLAAKVKSQ